MRLLWGLDCYIEAAESVKWGLMVNQTISGADIMGIKVANATMRPGGRDGAAQAVTAYLAYPGRRTVVAVSIQSRHQGRSRGRAWLLPADCTRLQFGSL